MNYSGSQLGSKVACHNDYHIRHNLAQRPDSNTAIASLAPDSHLFKLAETQVLATSDRLWHISVSQSATGDHFRVAPDNLYPTKAPKTSYNPLLAINTDSNSNCLVLPKLVTSIK